MGLFSSSKSSSNTTNLTTVDNSAMGAEARDNGQAIVLRGNDSSVEVLDAGAIAKAFDFAQQVNLSMDTAAGRVAQLATQNASDLRSFAEYQSQNESGRLGSLLQWGMVAGVVVFGVKYWRGAKA